MKSSLALGLIAFTLTAVAPAACLAQSRPNVILLVSDDAGYADFGFMNQFTGTTTEFKTPNLDALAQQSVKFSTAYVSAPVCTVSRAGFLTGRAPARFGVEYNVNNNIDLRDGIPAQELFISEKLKQNGYTTAAIGKWHLGSHPDHLPQGQGFDKFWGIRAGSNPYFGGVAIQDEMGAAVSNWASLPSFNNIPPDPVLGRHVTDAYGDEASQYVATHANQANPFFMYVPFTSPHSPYTQAKQQDLAEFDGTSLTGLRKNAAALTYAMDRAVGNIITRVNDPNGDGNTSDSIAGNTIIAFINDNGGNTPTDPATGGEEVHKNTPLRDWKGSTFEGGIRVPMLVKAPGLAPGVFDQAVTSLDLFPTFLAAADIAAPNNLDGTNLLPYLEGEQTGAVHDTLYWRGGVNNWAIRQGDWKLTKTTRASLIQLYHLNANGTGETTPVTAANPSIVSEMLLDYVDWETTLDKPTQTLAPNFLYLNRFDAFRFRTNLSTTLNWHDTTQDVWQDDESPGTFVKMAREDSYANAILVFQPRNGASYTSNNNISRASGLDYPQIAAGNSNPAGLIEFMLNELRFDGELNDTAGRSATLTGFPLMFVKDLNGAGARITLDATSVNANKISYTVGMDVVLHGNLEITGDSNQNYAITGQIRQFRDPRGITKTGTSSITLSGNNIYTGATIVNGGTLRIDGVNAALASTAKVQVGPQGTVALTSGKIHTPLLEISPGGNFNFTGGVLEAGQVIGALSNNGGQFRPGLSTGIVNISGNYNQNAGSLLAEIGGVTPGTQFDQIVANHVALGGSLQISLVDAGAGLFSPALGNSFEILKATTGVAGTFSSVSAPALSAGKKWAIQYTGGSVVLQVVSGLAADFDHNDMVNAADLAMWRSGWGSSALGDADSDLDTDGDDFLIWQREQGLQLIPASLGSFAAVPEPSTTLQACVAGFAVVMSRRSALRARGSETLPGLGGVLARLYRLFRPEPTSGLTPSAASEGR